MTGSRGRLLFISPVVPAVSGNGLAMRAGMTLRVLAECYDVVLVVVPVVASEDTISDVVRSWCSRAVICPAFGMEDPRFAEIARHTDPVKRLAAYSLYPKPLLCRFATPEAVRRVAAVFEEMEFDAVHVFRLYMVPFIEKYLRNPRLGTHPVFTLDMDDYESRTHLALAERCRANGDSLQAGLEQVEAQKYRHMENLYLRLFDRIFLASDRDRSSIVCDYGVSNMAVIPNGIDIPPECPTPRDNVTFTFLFVGTMGYYPNEDAALFFCGGILHRLRSAADREFRVVFAGANPTAQLVEAGERCGVAVTGAVPDISPFYRDASAVIAPVRTGGGTRIKILEAFAFRRAVVSTTTGAEGLDVRDGEHLLLADDPDRFTRRCAQLMERADARLQLAQRAFDFVAAHHSFGAIREKIIHVYPLPH